MKTTLRDALRAWQERSQPTDHPTIEELYAAAARGPLDPPLLAHVADCGRCARDLGEIAESIDAAFGFDLALPKAAAGPIASTVSLATACGKYAIGLYPRGDDEALVTIEVMPAFASELEGHTVTVTDGAGRVVLVAPIVLGRASARIASLRTLDLTRLVVRAGQAPPEG